MDNAQTSCNLYTKYRILFMESDLDINIKKIKSMVINKGRTMPV